MVQDATLGLSKTDIGAMTSAFPAAYGEKANLPSPRVPTGVAASAHNERV